MVRVLHHTLLPKPSIILKNIYDKLQAAQNQLNAYNRSLKNLNAQKNSIGSEFMDARVALKTAQTNLNDAQKAYDQVTIIKTYFEGQLKFTTNLVMYSQKMALQIFEATDFLRSRAIGQVQEVQTLVNNQNSTSSNDPTEQWTPTFTGAVSDANALAINAFDKSSKAVLDAFQAYISNQQIQQRTNQYYTTLSQYQTELDGILTRMKNEHNLVEINYLTIRVKNDAIQIRVNEMAGNVSALEFEVAQLKAEFQAAQQGAEFKFTPPTSTAS